MKINMPASLLSRMKWAGAVFSLLVAGLGFNLLLNLKTLDDADIFNACGVLTILSLASLLFIISALGKIVKTNYSNEIIVKKRFNIILSVAIVSQVLFSGWILHLNTEFQNLSGEIIWTSIIFSGQYNSFFLDAGTVLIISIFFIVESLIFFSQVMKPHPGAEKPSSEIHYSLIRPVIFLLMFGVEMSLSFVPIYMEQLYEPVAGISKELMLSLPVSVSVFFTGIAFFIAGAWTDRQGWHRPFLGGILLAGSGLLYAWMAPNALHFVIARAVSGTGYGLFFMAAQGFVIIHTDKSVKARGFASLFAALYAGIICGNASGALLVTRIGYRPVFLCGALIVFFAVFYTFIFMRHTFSDSGSPKKAAQPSRFYDILKFTVNRNVFAVTFLSSIPANMAMIGYLNYFNPLYLNRIGISTADIGRIFMIYGFFIIYGGPLISKMVDASDNKKNYIIFGGLLGSAAFLVFYFFSGLIASLAAVLLLGLSQSFVFVTQAAYLLKLKETEELGEGMAVGVFRSMNRLGQALGPVILSWLIASFSFRQSLICFGTAYFCITLLFFLIAQNDSIVAGASYSERQTDE